MVNQKDRYYVVAKIDEDQVSMYDERRLLKDYPEVITHYGMSYSKIHAVNRDLVQHNFDILCNHSDDMKFIKKGFDDVIRANIENDIFLHFPDQTAGDKLCTYSIMDSVYFNRDKYVYHPAYKSLWADNEAQEVAKKRGRYKYVDARILDHLHPSNTGEKMDAQYVKTEAFYHTDKNTFDRRKRRNFDIQTRNTDLLA